MFVRGSVYNRHGDSTRRVRRCQQNPHRKRGAPQAHQGQVLTASLSAKLLTLPIKQGAPQAHQGQVLTASLPTKLLTLPIKQGAPQAHQGQVLTARRPNQRLAAMARLPNQRLAVTARLPNQRPTLPITTRLDRVESPTNGSSSW